MTQPVRYEPPLEEVEGSASRRAPSWSGGLRGGLLVLALAGGAVALSTLLSPRLLPQPSMSQAEGSVIALPLAPPPEETVMAATADDGADEGDRPVGPEDLVPEEELGDPGVEIEASTEGAMDHFHQRLLSVARGEPGAVARVAFFSDSLNGCDRVASFLRRALAERFGDGGKGFLPVAPGWGSQEHRDVVWRQRLWRTARVNRGRESSGRYGLAGVIARNRGPRSRAIFATAEEGSANRATSLFQLYYQAWPEGGEVALQVDGGEVVRVSAAAEALEDRVYDLEVEEGAHRLTVSVGEGELRLYGVVMERHQGPGVVVDGLPYIGGTWGMLRHFDEEHLAWQIRRRAPDLLIFWIGANDVRAQAFGSSRYLERYGQHIARVRAGRPEASCLLMAEPDQGVEEEDGRIVSRRRVPQVVEAQRATAEAQGCAFLDLYAAIGGEGTARRWYRGSPRMLAPDLLHLTEAGAHQVGAILHDALLRDYNRSLRARR